MSLTVTPTGREAAAFPHSSAERALTAELPAALAVALRASGVRHCQWKGSDRPGRWSAGYGDIDLLVDRRDALGFDAVLAGLGFKRALPAVTPPVPGVVSYIGMDGAVDRLIHVHAHFRIVLGAPWARHVRIPVERALLDAATDDGSAFPTPPRAWEGLLFVLASTLKQRPWEGWSRQPPRWLREARTRLEYYEAATAPERIGPLLREHLPEVSLACFRRCLDSLHLRRPPWRRLLARYELVRCLRPHARRPPLSTLPGLLAWRAAARLPGMPLLAPRGKPLAGGGTVIALVGADGSGKSTCTAALATWLSRELLVKTFHLGRPPRSLTTILAGGLLRLAAGVASPSIREHATLLRCLATARDRYTLYHRARRMASAGGIALCERYPMPENQALVGPSAAQGVALTIRGPLAGALRRWESAYYTRMTAPDLVLVLRVPPDIAVARKTSEPAEYVRGRARLLWDVDWSRRGAILVDAGLPLRDVLARLRRHIWQAL
ncbi:MAG TPA: hypothetical protein VF970_01185 [Gemmatimonadales bacterium]